MKKAALQAVACLAAMAGVWLAAPAAAQIRPGDGESEAPRGPIAISSDRLEADETAGVVDFIGSVVARQGQMTITCDLMKVFYKTRTEPAAAEAEREAAASPLTGSREIDRVEGFGHVKMVDGDRVAVGDKALYLAHSEPRRLILTGDARVWQGQDSLTGHQITYYLDEKRSLVESERRQRVRTVISGGPGESGAP